MPASRTSFDYLGAETMLRQVKAMNREIAGVRTGKEIEPLHRMRVASRRLRAALRLFSGCLYLPDSIAEMHRMRIAAAWDALVSKLQARMPRSGGAGAHGNLYPQEVTSQIHRCRPIGTA